MRRPRLTAREVFTSMLRIPAPAGGLKPLTLYPAVASLIDAFDMTDEDNRPTFDELGFFGIKKSGKSTVAGGLALADLIGAGPSASEPDREIIIVASDLAQARDIVFASAVRFVRRSAWLSKHVTVRTSELIYRQTVTDHRTGARHVQEHVLRALPARDARSLHGSNPTLVVFDETWAHGDYSVFEALAPSASRRVSRRLYLSYAGLRSQQREGNPLWDLWQRWQRGDDPRLFVSFIGGPEGWKSIPWFSSRFLESQRRAFATVVSKFRRLFFNEWTAGDEASFFTDDEIQAAVDPMLGEPDTDTGCTLGLDVGLSNDYTAIVVAKVIAGRLTVLAVRTWRGSSSRPVQLAAVEEEIVSLAGRFGVRHIVADVWQSAYLVERLRSRLSARVDAIQITPNDLDRLASRLKNLFASRLVRLPAHPLLLEQLESLQGVEQRRRNLVRFQHRPGEHDDLCFALALAADVLQRNIGRPRLPSSFVECLKESHAPWTFNRHDCFLFHGDYFPSDPVCRSCEGFTAAKAMHRAHLESGGEPCDLRRFVYEYTQLPEALAWARLRAEAKRNPTL